MFRQLILITLLSAFSFNLSTFNITSINRAGARSLKGSVVIGVDNKSSDVIISDIKGTVYRGETALVNGKASGKSTLVEKKGVSLKHYLNKNK